MDFGPTGRSVGFGAAVAGFAGAQPVGLGAGFEDVGVEGDAVDDGGDKARVGKHCSPFGKWQVGGDRYRCSFLAFGDDLEQQFGAAWVDLDVPSSSRQSRSRRP